MTAIVKSRCEGLWLAPRAVRAGFEWAVACHRLFGDACPFCADLDHDDSDGSDSDSDDYFSGSDSAVAQPGAQEDLNHLWFYCRAWRKVRKQLLMPMVTKAVELVGSPGRLRDDDLRGLLQGGSLEGQRLSRWNGAPDQGVASAGAGTSQHACSSHEPIEDSQIPCVQIARFLAEVLRRRRQAIHAWEKDAKGP